MPARLYSLMLTRFAFPRKLENSKANFRFLVTVRYVAPKGKLASETVVMPGLDAFWECDTGRRGRPEYVRKAGVPEVDVRTLDPWDRLILHMRAEAIHSLQFRVLDVDRRDAWDVIRGLLGEVVGGLLRRGRETVPELPLASPLRDSLGSVSEDLETWVLQKVAAQRDKVLFRGSHFFESPNEPVAGPVTGRGVAGQYAIEFEVTAA